MCRGAECGEPRGGRSAEDRARRRPWAEIVVALVEGCVDRIAEQQSSGRARAGPRGRRPRRWPAGDRGPSLIPRSSTGIPSDPRRAASTWPWNEPTTVVRWTMRSDGCIRFEATVDLSGAQDLRARERVRRHLHASRPAPPEPGRGGPVPLQTGRELGPLEQRLPRERGQAVPRRRQPPRVRDAGVRLDRGPGRPRQGRRADPRGAGRLGREPPARRGHPRRHLPVQEQHRLRRQLLRLPRELPHEPAGRLLALRPGAHPVLRQPADLLRRRQGAADGARGDVLPLPARRAHLGGGLVGDDAQPADHQHPRRAPRGRRAVPAAARDRRRLEHERVRHVPQGGQRRASCCACWRTRAW